MLASMKVARNGREHDRAPLSDCRAEERDANPPDDGEETEGPERAGQARSPLRLAEHRDRRSLQPVEQDGLVDVRDAIEQRHQPVARMQHFAGQLGVVRLIGIHQARISEPPEHDNPRDSDPAQPDKLAGHEGHHIPRCVGDPYVFRITSGTPQISAQNDSKRHAEVDLIGARRDEVRSAERREEVVERFLVGQVDHAEPQRTFGSVAVEQVVDAEAEVERDVAARCAADWSHRLPCLRPECGGGSRRRRTSQSVIGVSRRRDRAAAEEPDRRLLVAGQRQRVVDTADRAGDEAGVVPPAERGPGADRLVERVLDVRRRVELLIVVDPEVARRLPRGGCRRCRAARRSRWCAPSRRTR